MNKSNIRIQGVRALPYGNCAEIKDEYPGFHLFDDSNDFLIGDDFYGLAVEITAKNTLLGDTRNNPKAQNYTINVTSRGKVIASKKISLRLSPWTAEEKARIDFVMPYHPLSDDSEYRISICRTGAKTTLATKTIRLFTDFNVPQVITADRACIVKNEMCFRDTSFIFYDDYRIRFVINDPDNSLNPERLPEMAVNIYSGDRQRFRLEGIASYIDSMHIQVEAEIDSSTIFESDFAYAELTIFGEAIAGMTFNISGQDEPGEYEWHELGIIPQPDLASISDRYSAVKASKIDPELESAKAKLESMVGLESVKAKIKNYAEFTRFCRLRSEAALPCPATSLHAMFLGSPGTGKTTVAKIMGMLLKDAGILSRGHVVVKERATLTGKYYGTEEEKTLEALNEAKGGILFIDEAYQLYRPNDPNDPGHFVVDALLTALADPENRDWMLILAGYTEPMLRMLSMNPGLASRIPQSNHYVFDDYTPAQLAEIAERHFSDKKYNLTTEAETAIRKMVEADYAMRGEDFGNARYIMSAIETQILPSMAHRLAAIKAPTIEQLMTIEACDIPRPRRILNPTRQRIGFIS